MDLTQRLKELVEEHLEGDDLFIVDIKASVNGGKQKVLILLDGDDGVSIEKCGAVSRKLANDIEEMNLIEDAYNLEVSSPGLNTPLTLKRQYLKNIGRKVKILLNSENEKLGELLEVSETKIKIKEEYKEKGKKKILYRETDILFSEIKKTNVLVTFK